MDVKTDDASLNKKMKKLWKHSFFDVHKEFTKKLADSIDKC